MLHLLAAGRQPSAAALVQREDQPAIECGRQRQPNSINECILYSNRTFGNQIVRGAKELYAGHQAESHLPGFKWHSKEGRIKWQSPGGYPCLPGLCGGNGFTGLGNSDLAWAASVLILLSRIDLADVIAVAFVEPGNQLGGAGGPVADERTDPAGWHAVG